MCGYMAVEFFFMLSGYFAVVKVKRSGESTPQDAMRWTVGKYVKLFPYILISTILHYLIYYTKSSLWETVKYFGYSFFELLCLPESGMFHYYMSVQLWYLSALLILLPLFYTLVMKNGDTFLHVLCPLFTVMMYGYFSSTGGQIGMWGGWLGICRMSIVRAWAGLCLGGVIYTCTEYVKNMPAAKSGSNTRLGGALSALEIACVVYVVADLYRGGHNKTDFICIFFMAVLCVIVLSEKASVHRLFPTFLCRASEFATSLYISHLMVRSYVKVILMPDAPYEKACPTYVVLSVIFACLLMLAVNGLRRLRIPDKIKMYLFG